MSLKKKWLPLIYVLAILHFALSYCYQAKAFLNLDAYLSYTERMPYQGRVFPALIFNGMAHLVRIPSASLGTSLPPHLTVFFVLSSAFFLLITVLLVGDIARRHLGYLPLTCALCSLSLIASAYFTYLVGYEFKFFLPYDLPSLGMWACVLWLAYQNQTLLGTIFFFIATINRETSLILIPCVMAIYYSKNKANHFFTFSLATMMFAIWLLIKYFTYQYFQHNPRDGNGLALNNIIKNSHLMINPLHWGQLASTWGFLAVPFILSWREITDPCHRVFKWVILATVILLNITGIVIEVRIFGELSILVIICLAGVLDARLRQNVKA